MANEPAAKCESDKGEDAGERYVFEMGENEPLNISWSNSGDFASWNLDHVGEIRCDEIYPDLILTDDRKMKEFKCSVCGGGPNSCARN